MTDPSAPAGFSGRRGRTFARVTAYTLLALFLISAVAAFLPPPFARPERLFTVLGEVVAERSTLPLLALVVLYAGLSGEAAPSLWEARLAAALRPLLRLVALLYLLTAVAIVAVAGEVQSQGLDQFKGQLQANLSGIAELRQRFNAAPDAAGLRRLLEQQPPFRAALVDPNSPLSTATATVAQQRQAALLLLDRAEANLRADDLRRRADAAGNLFKESLRLALTAAIYACFYLLASLLWPRRLGPWIDRIKATRQERAIADAEAEAEVAFRAREADENG